MLVTRRFVLGSAFATLVVLPARAAPAAAPRVITARTGRRRFRPQPAAETAFIGYDGQVPGPLLRCKRGDDFKFKLVNELDEAITVSCWGMRLDNAMDGVAGLTQKAVMPGQSFDYIITPSDSGFYWYRSDVAPLSGEQLRRGLYGPFIVDEPDPPVADRDILAVLAKWRLDADGQIVAGAVGTAVPHGAPAAAATAPQPVTTLNSETIPLSQELPPGARVRLRLLNADASEIMFVVFAGVKPMVMVIDGQPCEAFEPLQDLLPIGPGGRFELMFDLPAKAEAESRLILRSNAAPDQTLLSLKTKGEKRAPLPPIVSLPQNPLLPSRIKLEAAHRAALVIAGGATPTSSGTTSGSGPPFSLLGSAATTFAAKPLFSVARRTPVALSLVNNTAFAQEVHLHGHVMRLLHNLDDGWDPYWRDSAIIPGMHTKHVAFVADNPGKWAIECLPLGTRAPEMMVWFDVR